MSRKAPKTTCSLEQKQKLEKIVHSHTAEIRQIKRAKIILACLEDKPINTIAADLETCSNTVLSGEIVLRQKALAASPTSYDLAIPCIRRFFVQ